jgi:hypothetical protein
MFKKSLVLGAMLLSLTALADPPSRIHIAVMEEIVRGRRIIEDHDHSWALELAMLSDSSHPRIAEALYDPSEGYTGAELVALLAEIKRLDPNGELVGGPIRPSLRGGEFVNYTVHLDARRVLKMRFKRAS